MTKASQPCSDTFLTVHIPTFLYIFHEMFFTTCLYYACRCTQSWKTCFSALSTSVHHRIVYRTTNGSKLPIVLEYYSPTSEKLYQVPLHAVTSCSCQFVTKQKILLRVLQWLSSLVLGLAQRHTAAVRIYCEFY